MPAFTNLGDLIRRDLDQDKLAIIDLGGEGKRRFTYAELDAMANGVARGLTARGFPRGERIAILSANRTELIAAIYGIMRAGLVAVPVNFRFPRTTIEFILRDAGARLVFCDPARREVCPARTPVVSFGGPLPDPPPQAGEGARSAGEAFTRFLDPGPFEAVAERPDEPAMFLYTSGSTGTPKGVVLSHQSHIWVVETRLD